MQNSRTEKGDKNAALFVYAVFGLLLTATFVMTKSEISSRPAPAPAEESASAKSTREPPPSPMEGKPVPDFSLPTLDGKVVKLADLKGKTLFINIWATWCAPCKEEMPSMEALYRQLKGPTFEMVAISIDKDGAKSVAPFVKELKLTFPILLDPESAVASKFKITGVPETYLVAGNGTIIHHLIGPMKWDRPEVISSLKQLVSMNDKAREKKRAESKGP